MGDTLVNIRTALRLTIGNPTTSQVADSVLTAYINRAVKEIADRYRFHATRKVATFNTVSGTDKYILPSDYNVLMKVAIQTSGKFQPLRKTSFGFINANPTQSNQEPTRYAVVQNYLQLWPTPDDIYSIQLMYRFNPVTLSGDSDASPFPTAWDDGVKYCARHMYWDDNGDVAKAVYALNKYNQWLDGKSDEIGLEYFADWEQGVSIPTLLDDDSAESTPSSFDTDD